MAAMRRSLNILVEIESKSGSLNRGKHLESIYTKAVHGAKMPKTLGCRRLFRGVLD